MIVTWFAILLLVGQTARYIAPVGPENIHFEIKVYTKTDKGLELVNLQICEFSTDNNTADFVNCLHGPNEGCFGGSK